MNKILRACLPTICAVLALGATYAYAAIVQTGNIIYTGDISFNGTVTNGPSTQFAFGNMAKIGPANNGAWGTINSVIDAIMLNDSYHDNVGTLQNLSLGTGAGGVGVGQCGNAAWRFADSVTGKERGAMGYSSVGTGCASGFNPDYLYIEIGNINSAPDTDDTSFAVINTHSAAASHLAGTSYKAINVSGSDGTITLQTAPNNGTWKTKQEPSSGVLEVGSNFANVSASFPIDIGVAIGDNLSSGGQEADWINTQHSATKAHRFAHMTAIGTFVTDADVDMSSNWSFGGGVNVHQYTVGTLPTCNSGTKGLVYEVTDANAPTWNATLSGGGAVFTLAVCNGTNWTAH